MADDGYYRYHVFFCVNQREPGAKECCADKNAMAMRDHAKQRIKELGLHGRGGIRVNQAGCLDRCAEGPTVVVYPEGIWYTYVDALDIDEIIDRHLREGQIVERLRI